MPTHSHMQIGSPAAQHAPRRILIARSAATIIGGRRARADVQSASVLAEARLCATRMQLSHALRPCRPRPHHRRPRPRRRPHNLLTYHPSARGRLGEQRASLSAAISQASTAPRRTPLCEPSSLNPRLHGSARLMRKARAPGGGPTALHGTTPTGPLVSQTLRVTRIVPIHNKMRLALGTIELVCFSKTLCVGCHSRRRRRRRRRRPLP